MKLWFVSWSIEKQKYHGDTVSETFVAEGSLCAILDCDTQKEINERVSFWGDSTFALCQPKIGFE